MYQAFKAVVSQGKIKPLEKVKLKESQMVLVTVVEEETLPEADWIRLKKWISKQRKEKKYSSYSSPSAAKQHLSRLSKS